MSDFLSMGGYGMYVWPAYGVSFIVLAAAFWLVRRQHTQTQARLKRRLSNQDNRS